jgi:hypothetical protein
MRQGGQQHVWMRLSFLLPLVRKVRTTTVLVTTDRFARVSSRRWFCKDLRPKLRVLGADMVAAAVGTELMLGQTAACPFLLFLVLVSGARFLFNGENTGTPTTRTEKEVMACPHDTC